MWSFFLLGIKEILKTFKKIFIVLVVFLSIILIFLNFISKNIPSQTIDPIKKNREEIYKIINDKTLNQTNEGKIMIFGYRLITCGLIGEGCTNNPDDGEKYFSKSVFGFISGLIILPYANPPASGVFWVYNTLQNAGFIPKTYAAEGIGLASLRPFMNVWKVFRDISYMILVLVLVAIGFMIMFRQKINPQTVITVENSLPKIVVSLLLITFSFAIAGFLIDLMYFLIVISISFLSQRNSFFNANEFIENYTNSRFTGLFAFWPKNRGNTFLNLGPAIVNILPLEINFLLRSVVAIAANYILLPQIINHLIKPILEGTKDTTEGVFGALGLSGGLQIPILGGLIKLLAYGPFVFTFGLIIGGIVFFAFPLLISLLILFTILFLVFRIFFLLFTTYIRILLMIIFSPIILLFEAIPGKSTFSWWIKNLFAEILTFPIVIVLAIVGYIIANTPATKSINLWQPPFLSDLNPDSFIILLGVGLVLIIPDLIKMVKEFLGAKGMPVGFGLGTFFAGVGAGWTGVTTFAQMGSSLGQLPFIGSWLSQQQWYKNVFGSPLSQQIVNSFAEAKKKGYI